MTLKRFCVAVERCDGSAAARRATPSLLSFYGLDDRAGREAVIAAIQSDRTNTSMKWYQALQVAAELQGYVPTVATQ